MIDAMPFDDALADPPGSSRVVVARPDGAGSREERFALPREGEARLRALVDAHFAFIWRTVRGLGVAPGGADDAAQQVFCIAAHKLDAITPGSERAFLVATARGVAANARRAQARHPEGLPPEALERHPDLAKGAEELLEEHRARARLDRILAELPEEYRAVFVFFELEELTMAEIATLLDLPPGTVASRLRRARELFQSGVKRMRAADTKGTP